MQPHPRLQLKPHMPREIVARLRLIGRLSAGLHRRPTVICALARCAETTLTCEWI